MPKVDEELDTHKLNSGRTGIIVITPKPVVVNRQKHTLTQIFYVFKI